MSHVNRIPEAKRPGYLHPWAGVARAEEAAEDEARAQAEAAQEEFEREVLALREANACVRIMLADVKFELALRALGRKYSQNQSRVPAGSPQGGQWTSGANGVGGSANDHRNLEQGREGLPTAPDQSQRSDLAQLQAIANDPAVRSRVDEAWSASNPAGRPPQEHGFWISRNDATGEVFTRPFANPGSGAQITPGPAPADAVAFFHTHPNRGRPDVPFTPGPSRGDQLFAADVGLPGVIQSHNGMYYFGPELRLRRTR
jgi:hypothetical protein